ncbi:hypothetical protein BU17DRAFT_66395 [Hysterangium stoloniferum]|nr:hypothetical protein BU17DRAFT_66395 [Hysterangium stoloniferum]
MPSAPMATRINTTLTSAARHPTPKPPSPPVKGPHTHPKHGHAAQVQAHAPTTCPHPPPILTPANAHLPNLSPSVRSLFPALSATTPPTVDTGEDPAVLTLTLLTDTLMQQAQIMLATREKRYGLLPLWFADRIRIRNSSSVFKVSLLQVKKDRGTVEVLWDGGQKREFKWGSIVWSSSGETGRKPTAEEIATNPVPLKPTPKYVAWTSSTVRCGLKKLGIADKYSFERPGCAPGPHIVESYAAVNSIVRDRATFHTPYVPRVQQIFENRASGLKMTSEDIETYSLENLISSAAGLNQGDPCDGSSINSDFRDEGCRNSSNTGISSHGSNDLGSHGSWSDSCDRSMFRFISVDFSSDSSDGDYVGVDRSDDNQLSCLVWQVYGERNPLELRAVIEEGMLHHCLARSSHVLPPVIYPLSALCILHLNKFWSHCCDRAVFPSIAVDHAEKHDKIKGVLKDLGDELAAQFNLIASVDEMKQVWPQTAVERYHGNEKSVKADYRAAHKGKGVMYTGFDRTAGQQIWLCANFPRLLAVTRIWHTQTDGRGTLEFWKNSLKRAPLRAIPLSTAAREIAPWLHKVRWLEFVRHLDAGKVQRMWDLKTPKGEELWILAALGSYLGHAGKMITTVPIQVGQWFMCFEGIPTSQSFDGVHMEETYRRYPSVMGSFLLMIRPSLSSHRGIFELPLSAEQMMILDSFWVDLRDSRGNIGDRGLQAKLHALMKSSTTCF